VRNYVKSINHLQDVVSSNRWVKKISRRESWMSAHVHKVIWINFLYATVYMWLWWFCANCCLIYGFTNANVMHALCDFLSLIPNWSIPIDPLLEVARTSRLIHSGWACELSKSGTHFMFKPTRINVHKTFIKVSLLVFRGLLFRGAQIFQKSSSHPKILSASRSA
jgi:hypothetical protein